MTVWSCWICTMGDLSQYDAIHVWKAIRNLPKSKIRWGVGVWGVAQLRPCQTHGHLWCIPRPETPALAACVQPGLRCIPWLWGRILDLGSQIIPITIWKKWKRQKTKITKVRYHWHWFELMSYDAISGLSLCSSHGTLPGFTLPPIPSVYSPCIYVARFVFLPFYLSLPVYSWIHQNVVQ